MKKLLALALIAASLSTAHAGEPTKAELYATLSSSFDLYTERCPGKIGLAFTVFVAMNDDKSNALQKAKARSGQISAINYLGLSAWCNLLDGQSALMDKKVSEAK